MYLNGYNRWFLFKLFGIEIIPTLMKMKEADDLRSTRSILVTIWIYSNPWTKYIYFLCFNVRNIHNLMLWTLFHKTWHNLTRKRCRCQHGQHMNRNTVCWFVFTFNHKPLDFYRQGINISLFIYVTAYWLNSRGVWFSTCI